MKKNNNTKDIWQSARAAFDSMEKFGIMPNVKNYAVWFAYHCESISSLKSDIDAIIEQGKQIDDYFCASLYENHIEKHQLSDKIIDAGGSLESQMRDIMDGIEETRRETRAFSDKLSSARVRLKTGNSAEIVKDLVEDLSKATDKMMEHSSALEDRITLSHSEISSLRKELEEARSEASKDALTGVANRKTFNLFLHEAIKNQKKTRKPLSLIMCDIDLFKRINDKWGHQTGDQVICYVSGVLQNYIPKNGLVARLGGEEFAIIAPDIDAKEAREIAEKIRQTVERKKLIRRTSKEDLGQITISLGVGQRNINEDPSDFIDRVDKALYTSKNKGRNQTSSALQLVKKAA